VSLLVSFTIFGIAARQIALMSIYFAGNTRLPMVAGWDNLLPGWFARLHERYRTPVNSILFVGLITLAFSLVSLIGVKEQEAFQLQDNAATTLYALIYIVLFAIPLVAIRRFEVKAPLWLKIAAVSGFLVSVLGGVFSLIPITPVDNPWLFATKIMVVVVGANVIGLALYKLRKPVGNV
jgi:amino acid transporter